MRESEEQGSLYDVLGVARDAGLSEIQRAYRTLGSRHHPDRFLDEDKKKENGEIFRRISDAYRVLKDPELRRKYDDEKFAPQANQEVYDDDLHNFFHNFFGHSLHSNGFFPNFHHSPMGSVFDSMDSMMGNMFDDPFFDHDFPPFGNQMFPSNLSHIRNVHKLNNGGAHRNHSSSRGNRTDRHLVNANKSNAYQRGRQNSFGLPHNIPREIREEMMNSNEYSNEFIDENQNKVKVSFKKSTGKHGSSSQFFSYSSTNMK